MISSPTKTARIPNRENRRTHRICSGTNARIVATELLRAKDTVAPRRQPLGSGDLKRASVYHGVAGPEAKETL